MATIPSATNQLRHVRKTVTFDGTAGNGAVGTVTIFSLTGRVRIMDMTLFCSASLTEAAPTATLIIGTAWSSSAVTPSSINATDWDELEWWIPGVNIAGGLFQTLAHPDVNVFPKALSNVDIIATVGGQNITGGTIVIDAWYYAITDNGALAGDDIDAGYTPADVKVIANDAITAAAIANGAIDAATFAADVDAEVRSYLGLASADLDTQLAALPTAAEVVNEWESQSQADPTGFHVNVKEVNGTAQTANDNGADINAILVDTNELQGDLTDGGRLDLIVDAILDDTDLIDDATSGLAKIATDAAAILVDTSTTLQGELDDIQADTEDIQARLPAALTGDGNIKADAIMFDGISPVQTAGKLWVLDGSGNAIAPASATTGIVADTEDIQARLPAALVGGRIDATVDGTGMESGAVDAILDEVVEGSYTFRQFLRLFAAALGGELSGAATTTITIRDASDSKTRVTATVDEDGNRSAVTLDLT